MVVSHIFTIVLFGFALSSESGNDSFSFFIIGLAKVLILDVLLIGNTIGFEATPPIYDDINKYHTVKTPEKCLIINDKGQTIWATSEAKMYNDFDSFKYIEIQQHTGVYGNIIHALNEYTPVKDKPETPTK